MHRLEDFALVSEAPVQWALLDDDERARSSLTPDVCRIESPEGTSFYVRACLALPVHGAGTIEYGVWCSLSEASFARMQAHWEDEARAATTPYFGWLCTAIAGFPDTVFLKTHVHERRPGLRPWVELEPTEHPLAVAQRSGISRAVAVRLVELALHGQ